MKASELIAKLAMTVTALGDVEVLIEEYPMDDSQDHSAVTGVSFRAVDDSRDPEHHGKTYALLSRQ